MDIPAPQGSHRFGTAVTALPNGNFVVTDPGFSEPGGTGAIGAVYLYDGRTLQLISRLTGSSAGDQVGADGITVVSGGNYVVNSPHWKNGELTKAGAVTWCSGTTGRTGVVSAANSLVGGAANTRIGSQRGSAESGNIIVLSSGNYLLCTPDWHDGTAEDMGALTWCRSDGTVTGVISAANSLTGSSPEDRVGRKDSIKLLPDGNFLTYSYFWDNGDAVNAGALTWGSGGSPTVGVVSAATSLVGSATDDHVGENVIVLSSGNYLVASSGWDNGSIVDAGALTWGSAAGGVRGVVSAENSVVGSRSRSGMGRSTGVFLLANGNYVASDPFWSEGAGPTVRGAVRWCSGTSGATGPLTEKNSLTGGRFLDQVGNVYPLPDGNYVVASPSWDNGASEDVGAVTWCDGARGTVGVVSAENSLTGFAAGDAVGSAGIVLLTNGNFVVCSPDWRNTRGAVTFMAADAPVRGIVSASNSLVGGQDQDGVGAGALQPWIQGRYVVPLSNGHYVIGSPWWDNGAAIDAGAVTWGSGTTGVKGLVSAGNSLVGGTAGDMLGIRNWDLGNGSGIVALGNGHYVVSSPWWDHGAVADAGAVTWGSGTEGVKGPVSAANSLVGSSRNDVLGAQIASTVIYRNGVEVTWGSTRISDGVTVLGNGNYVIPSPWWDHGAAVNAGAVTWGSGTEGVRGVVSAENSLVGSSAYDLVGTTAAILPLNHGDYVVFSNGWDDGTIADAGAATFASGVTGVAGMVSPDNSLIGGGTTERLGSRDSAVPLPGGGCLIRNPSWRDDTGAVTFVGAAPAGVTGKVSGSNSLIGSQPGDSVGGNGIQLLSRGGYLVQSPAWSQYRGAVTWGGGTVAVTGEVSAQNSLVGSTEMDQVGYNWPTNPAIHELANGNYLVVSPHWTKPAGTGSGAVTWVPGGTGIRGVVSAENSLVNTSVEGRLGDGALTLSPLEDGNYVVPAGVNSFALGDGMKGSRGPLTATNAMLGPNESYPPYVYNPVTATLITGYPWHNRVSLLSLDNSGGVPETILQKWRSQHFGGAAAGTGDLEDFDADGVSNLLEFTFGTHPTDSASGPAALQFSGTVAGGGALTAAGSPVLMSENGALSVLFVRRQDHAVAGLGYTVQFSTDLRTWTASAENPRILADDGTSQLVTVLCPWESGAAAGFFRLRVTVAP